MEEQLSDRDIRAIGDYVTGARIPKGRVSPKKLLRRLNRCIACLEEYDLFQSAGSLQEMFHQRLQEYRNLRDKLVSTMEWYDMANEDTPEGEWLKEFHRVGMFG